MAGRTVKGVAEIELRTNRFTQPAREAGREIKTLGTKSKSTFGEISSSSKLAANDLRAIGTTSQTAFRQMSVSSQAATAQVKANAAQLNAARIQTIGMASGVATMGASFVALETSISNIPKRLNAIEKAEVGLARAQDLVANKNTALKKLELSLTKAREKGKKSAIEISLIEEKITNTRSQLATATQDLSAKQEDLNLKHSDYADTMKLFTTSIIITAITATSTMATTLATMATAANLTTGAFIKLKFSTLAQSNALKFLGFNFKAASIAMKGATFSLVGFRAGIKATWLALGPIGIAIIGITVAYEIWANNVGGVQEKMGELWQFLKQFIPQLKVLESVVKALFPPTTEGVEELGNAIEGTALQAEAFADTGNNMTDGLNQMDLAMQSAANSSGAMAANLGTATINLQTFQQHLQGDSINNLNTEMETLFQNVSLAADQMEEFPERVNLAMESIAPNIQNISNKFDLAWGAGAFAKRLNEMKKFGSLTRAEFDLITKTINVTSSALDGLKKKQTEIEISQNGIIRTEKEIEIRKNRNAGQPQSNRIRGFIGDTITVGGKTFQSRLTAARQYPRGGDAANAIRTAQFARAAENNRRVAVPQWVSQQRKARDAYANSAGRVLDYAIRGWKVGTLSKSAAQKLRYNTGLKAQIGLVREARRRGLFNAANIAEYTADTGYSPFGDAQQGINFATLYLKKDDRERSAKRTKSFSLLANRLKLSKRDLYSFTRSDSHRLVPYRKTPRGKLHYYKRQYASTEENSKATKNFLDPITQQTDYTRQQANDFITNHTGRQNLANLIGWTQREELLRVIM